MKIVYLDFDGTLLTHDSGLICALPSIRRGLLGPAIAARLIGTYLLSKTGLRTRTDAMRVGFECYGGRDLAELRTIMQELHERHMRGHVSGPMRARVEAHRRAGDTLVILTASAFFFAEPMGRELDAEVIGTQVGWDAGGRCTGRVAGEIIEGEAKAGAALRHATERGATLAECAFYTDHVADLPLLERVGQPVVVGPHRALARVARRRGWPVVEH